MVLIVPSLIIAECWSHVRSRMHSLVRWLPAAEVAENRRGIRGVDLDVASSAALHGLGRRGTGGLVVRNRSDPTDLRAGRSGPRASREGQSLALPTRSPEAVKNERGFPFRAGRTPNPLLVQLYLRPGFYFVLCPHSPGDPRGGCGRPCSSDDRCFEARSRPDPGGSYTFSFHVGLQ